MSPKTQQESTTRPATVTIPELEQSKTGRSQCAGFSTLTTELSIRHRPIYRKVLQ